MWGKVKSYCALCGKHSEVSSQVGMEENAKHTEQGKSILKF